MDRDRLEKQLQNSKIREGPMLKRSKFLKEWRQRWVVLTFNYIITFTSKNYKDVTDVMDLKTVKSYKSYVSKSQQMIPASFKIRSGQSSLYFCAKSTQQKWSWIVTLQRLLDYRQSGANNYNNVTFIKTKGFPSLEEFLNPKLDMNDEMANYKALVKTAQKRKDELQKQSIEMAKKMFIEHENIERQRQQIKKERIRVQLLRDQLKGIKDKNQSSNSRESQSIGNVKKLSNLYQNKAISHNYVKKQFAVSKQNIVNGIFDQFQPQSPQYFGFKYFTDFIILICSDPRLAFQNHIINACRSHPHRNNFAQIFIQILTEYQPFASMTSRVSTSFTSTPLDLQYMENLLKFINFILKEKLQNIFTIHELQILANKVKDFLLGDESDSSQEVQIILEIMLKIQNLRKYQKEDIEERLIKINKLSKKEVISIRAKDLLNSL